MEKIVSVITVCYNEKEKITETLQSVRRQMTQEVEYIIVDGASKDGTVDIVRAFCEEPGQNNLDVRYISESDNGIYDAMNKGIGIAKGKYIVFINAGDILIKLPIDQLKIADTQTCSAVAFPVAMDVENNLFIPVYDGSIRTHNTLHHQGLFYRRSEMQEYDVKYRVFADFDYNQKLFRNGKKVLVYKDAQPVALHDTEGVSHAPRYVLELLTVIKNNFGIWYCVLGFLYGGMNMVRNRIRKWANQR